jgi:lysozyme
MKLTPSARCAEFIKGYEQCRLKAFKPTPDDVWTIGWGHTHGVKPTDVWTQEKADAMFLLDLSSFADQVVALLGSAKTTQNQFDALVSFAYNEGAGPKGLGGSTLLRLHKAGDYAGAAEHFADWNKQNHKVLNGLTKRRAAEAAIYRS